MATREEWNRLVDLAWDLALVEYDLRERVNLAGYEDDFYAGAGRLAERVLFERFGVDADGLR